MRKFVIGSFVVWILVEFVCSSKRTATRVSRGRDCPTTFNFLLDAYRSCAIQRRLSVTRGQRKQITGVDILVRFQEICSSRPQTERCSKSIALEGCSKQHLDTFQTAMDKSFWFCDEDNNIRGKMARALTDADVTSTNISESQRNTNNCIVQSEMLSCPATILRQKRFARFKKYGNVIHHHAHQVLSDPDALDYFKAIFNCYFENVRARCPQNAIAMTIESQDHLFFPPKFGVNVSEIVMRKTTEIQQK